MAPAGASEDPPEYPIANKFPGLSDSFVRISFWSIKKKKLFKALIEAFTGLIKVIFTFSLVIP